MPLIRKRKAEETKRCWPCPEEGCCKEFTHMGNYNTHMKRHLGIKPFKCGESGCEAAFTDKKDLATHARSHTGERPFVCCEVGCDAAFTASSALKTHMRTHTGERPFVCDYPGCGHACTTSGALVCHVRTHTGEKPYACDVCDYTCTSAGGLQTHKVLHCNDASYICPEEGCSSTFKTKSRLHQHHQRIHQHHKRHTCGEPGCAASFCDAGDLNKHTMIHTGEKPFTCQWDGCGATFNRTGNRNLHMLTHTSIKPFSCPSEDCDATFRLKSNMQKHYMTCCSEEGRKRQKKQEERVATALTSANIMFKREHCVNLACMGKTSARADFLIIQDGGVIIVEVDESQHSHYSISCEVTRMANMHSAFALEGNTLPVAIIRYNPDAFRVNDKLTRVLKKDREAALIKIIREWSFGLPCSLEVLYMFYDSITSDDHAELIVWKDEEYDGTMLTCCLKPILSIL